MGAWVFGVGNHCWSLETALVIWLMSAHEVSSHHMLGFAKYLISESNGAVVSWWQVRSKTASLSSYN